jgi:ParB family chromosome partitioning protein
MTTETAHELLELAPGDIGPNPENPRLHFTEQEMEELTASIDKSGILVPINVFKNPTDAAPNFVLIDGERRWRCASALGFEAIPAVVVPPPDPTENLLTMFDIHMVREPWDDMPTAWALEKLIERTGVDDNTQLAEMTNMNIERIKRLRFALKLPTEYQTLIDTGEIPLNFFYELQRNVINPMSVQRPGLFAQFGSERILESFVTKKRDNVTPDTVELRRISSIIRIAAQEAGSPEADSDLDEAIAELINVPERTIQETYENTVEMVVEAEKFARQCDLLIKRFDRLAARAETNEDRELVISSARDLLTGLAERIDVASELPDID